MDIQTLLYVLKRIELGLMVYLPQEHMGLTVMKTRGSRNSKEQQELNATESKNLEEFGHPSKSTQINLQ